ncbi:DUF5320 domain-containing protein [Candidatus Latescibacterota bacterium]
MPNLNGMGPQGIGPRSGRVRGICGSGIHSFIGRKRNTLSLLSVVVPTITAVIIDTCKSKSYTRKLYSSFVGKIKGISKHRGIIQ